MHDTKLKHCREVCEICRVLAGAQAAPGPEGTPVPVELYSCCSASEAAGTDPILPKRNRASKDATSPAPSETSEEVDVATPSEADNESGEACVVVPGFQSSRPAAGPVPSDVEGKCCVNPELS